MEQRDNWHLTDGVPHEMGRGDPFAAAVRATRMAMVVTDPAQPDNPIVFVNEAFQKMTGYSRDEIVGHNCRFLQGPETDRDAVARIRNAVEAEDSVNVDILNYRKDGSTFWNALSMSPVRNADGTLAFFFGSQMDVTDRVERVAELGRQRDAIDLEVKNRTAELEQALAAKNLLLHEVDHRVKNNLNMIGSLIRLQARQVGDARVAARLDAMLERVDALAAVHRRLYQSDDLTRFDVGAFARELVGELVGASGRQDVRMEAEVERVEIGSAKAAPIGLAINEIATNALKHGLRDGRAGVLAVQVRLDGEQAVVRIADDGHGLPPNPTSGLGRTLVERLARQAGGNAVWSDAAPGTAVTLTFPLAG